MKHFIIELAYSIPSEQLGDAIAEHRLFLQTGYKKGWLLVSGPQVPMTGGIVVARAPSLEALVEFFQDDPFQVRGLAKYRYVEFDPRWYQPFMDGWLK